jgi:hypothetical protein
LNDTKAGVIPAHANFLPDVSSLLFRNFFIYS